MSLTLSPREWFKVRRVAWLHNLALKSQCPRSHHASTALLLFCTLAVHAMEFLWLANPFERQSQAAVLRSQQVRMLFAWEDELN